MRECGFTTGGSRIEHEAAAFLSSQYIVAVLVQTKLALQLETRVQRCMMPIHRDREASLRPCIGDLQQPQHPGLAPCTLSTVTRDPGKKLG
eukprot:1159339-Pelagomonas_calceolata.AAC.8